MDSGSGNVNIERNKLGKIHAICLLHRRDMGPQIKVEMPVVNQELWIIPVCPGIRWQIWLRSPHLAG